MPEVFNSSEESQTCIDVDLIVNETKSAVAELLKKRLLPRTTHALYVDSVTNARSLFRGRWTFNDIKYLLLAILYVSTPLKLQLIALLSPGGLLGKVSFPRTMVPKVDPASRLPGDTLSKYVLRFVMRQDTLADRELGSAMGGV